jgi:hypothetical protein
MNNADSRKLTICCGVENASLVAALPTCLCAWYIILRLRWWFAGAPAVLYDTFGVHIQVDSQQPHGLFASCRQTGSWSSVLSHLSLWSCPF